MLYPLAALIVSWIIWTAITRGTSLALGRAWALAILCPVWICVQVGSGELDLRCAAVVTALGCVAIVRDWSGPGRKSRFCWSDAAAALIVLAQFGSAYQNSEIGAKAICDIGTQWAMPYLLGRLMFRSPSEGRRLQAIVCTLCLILSVWVISEAVLRVNVVNRLLDHRGSEQGEGVRWGLRRAEGPTSHPIYCGLLLVSLFPWTFQASRMARCGEGPSWWKAAPWLVGAATICTMSRSSQLALLLILAVMGFFRWPRYRTALLTAGCACSIAAYCGQDLVLDMLRVWAKESPEQSSKIRIEGVEYEYTGTTHRTLQFRVYRQAMLHAGFFGYGVKTMSERPLVIPHVEPRLLVGRFNSIDNHYIYFLLVAGYLGIGSFLLLGVLSLVGLWAPASNPLDPDWPLAAGLFGSQLAIMVFTLSVWFSDDFGFQWLFNAGYIASAHAFARSRALAPERSGQRLAPSQRYWPALRERLLEPVVSPP
jgi:hypothetical protein